MSITLVRNLDWAVATSEVMKAKSFMASNGSFEYGSGLIESNGYEMRYSLPDLHFSMYAFKPLFLARKKRRKLKNLMNISTEYEKKLRCFRVDTHTFPS